METRRGRTNPGTWGHWQVALKYAQYLSPEFAIWCT
ncbi:MAG: KilA-N domain-containing protein [Desulfobacteraceae bacterium]|nr:KilA-N domain-containing protein [Desulfobacteraceae bacterium]